MSVTDKLLRLCWSHIHHPVLICPPSRQVVVHFLEALVPQRVVLYVGDDLGNPVDDQLQELWREDEVLLPAVKVAAGLLEPKVTKN